MNASHVPALARDVTSAYFWGVSELAHFVGDVFFDNNSPPMVLVPAVDCPAEYVVLPFLPCETANFQGWG